MASHTPPLLRRIYPLNQLPPQLLSRLRPTFRLQKFRAGHTLFKIGDMPPDYYYVIDGEIQLDTKAKTGEQVITPATENTQSMPIPYMTPSQHTARVTKPSTILLASRGETIAAADEWRKAQGTLLKTRPANAEPTTTPAPRKPTAPLPPPITRPERILLIEDNPTEAKIVQLMLRKLGYSSEWVDSFEGAALPLARERFDVILMDVELPGIDGFDAATKLREDAPPGRGPRIIAVTGFIMPGARTACLASGMDDYIPKPLSPQILEAKLDPATWQLVDDFLVERMVESLGKPGVRQVIDTYFEGLDDMLSRLESAVKSGEPNAVRDAAHSFKAASETLGLRRIAGYARRLELLGKSRKTGGCNELLAQILEVRADTEHELERVYAKLA